MAQGDVTLFNQFKAYEGDGTCDMDGHVFRAALITVAITPAADTADPCWGAGGTTDLSTAECTPGGNYAAGGSTLTGVTFTETGGTVTWDADNVAIAQSATNPADARWVILYDDTATVKPAVAFVDLGGVTDLSAGGFSLTWSGSGIYSKT